MVCACTPSQDLPVCRWGCVPTITLMCHPILKCIGQTIFVIFVQVQVKCIYTVTVPQIVEPFGNASILEEIEENV